MDRIHSILFELIPFFRGANRIRCKAKVFFRFYLIQMMMREKMAYCVFMCIYIERVVARAMRRATESVCGICTYAFYSDVDDIPCSNMHLGQTKRRRILYSQPQYMNIINE